MNSREKQYIDEVLARGLKTKPIDEEQYIMNDSTEDEISSSDKKALLWAAYEVILPYSILTFAIFMGVIFLAVYIWI